MTQERDQCKILVENMTGKLQNMYAMTPITFSVMRMTQGRDQCKILVEDMTGKLQEEDTTQESMEAHKKNYVLIFVHIVSLIKIIFFVVE